MLTKTAFLNAVQLIVDQLARIVVGFLLVPILVTELGPAIFGLWQVLQKASLQISMLDGRSPEVLKWIIASKQGEIGVERKQQSVASALIVLLFFLPVLMLAYGLFIAFLPGYLNLQGETIYQARLVVALLALAAVITAGAMLFEAVIRGSNKAFKLLGFQALVLIAGGIMSVVAVSSGKGVVGLAAVQVLMGLLFFMAYFFVAKKNIKWLGFLAPNKSDFLHALHKSKWFTLWAFVSALVFTGDIIVMAAFLDGVIVSQYVLTSYAMQIITIAILTALASILPGLGGILGEGEYVRAKKIRNESLLLSWWLTTTMCVVLMVVNRSFLQLWVGEGQYLGRELNLLVALVTFQLIFIRHDANLLNVALDVKHKTLLGLSCLFVTFSLMLFLIPLYGVYGVCFSLLIGRSILFFSYPRLVFRILKSKSLFFNLQKITTTFLAFFAGWKLSAVVSLDSWFELVWVMGLIFIFLLGFIYMFGMSRQENKSIMDRVKLLVISKRAE